MSAPARLVSRPGGSARPLPVLGRPGLGRDHHRRTRTPVRRPASRGAAQRARRHRDTTADRRPTSAPAVGLVAGRRGRGDGARRRRRAGGPIARRRVARRPWHTPGRTRVRIPARVPRPRAARRLRSTGDRVRSGQLSYPRLPAPFDAPIDDSSYAVRPRRAEPAGVGRALPDGQTTWVAWALIARLLAGDGFYGPEQGAGGGGRLRGGTVLRQPRDQPDGHPPRGDHGGRARRRT